MAVGRGGDGGEGGGVVSGQGGWMSYFFILCLPDFLQCAC